MSDRCEFDSALKIVSPVNVFLCCFPLAILSLAPLCNSPWTSSRTGRIIVATLL